SEGAGGEVGLILLDASTPGLRIHEPLRTLGMRGNPVADVVLDRVRVEPWRLLSRDGRRLLRQEHDRLRDAVAALCAGVVASSAEAAIAYARERYQGGCFIIEHPEVRRMISELVADRDQCLDAVEQLATGGLPEPRATHLFLNAKEAAARATCDGVQLLGGYGYMEDYGQERRMRDGQQARALLGRPDVLRQEVITDHLRGAA
ncbi:MAG: acyl-CoA dehydrogenase family protein, partial [Myxococcota bacterium]